MKRAGETPTLPGGSIGDSLFPAWLLDTVTSLYRSMNRPSRRRKDAPNGFPSPNP